MTRSDSTPEASPFSPGTERVSYELMEWVFLAKGSGRTPAELRRYYKDLEAMNELPSPWGWVD